MSKDPQQQSNRTQTSIFDHGGDFTGQTSTRSERAYRHADQYVLAPIRVGLTDWRMPVGGIIVCFFILLGTIGVDYVPAPKTSDGVPKTPAFVDWAVPLGTDNLGQGVAKQLVHATPAMLKMALAGAIVATGLAVIIGTVAGYKGGTVDSVLMTLTDVVMTIPALPLVIVLAAIYQPKDPFVVGMILAIDNWPGLARALRSQVLTIREESYIEAARTMGISSPTVLGRDIVPQMMPYILINAANAARTVIFESVALYFLGFLPFSTFNWGVMLNLAYQAGAMSNIDLFGHWLIAPMVTLAVFSFGLILFSQGLDRVFNPRLRARHAKTVSSDDRTDISSD
ncbi:MULTISPECIES: ABC transporter permease [unclassified Haladaptatus]|uniref:ABC transporter permease n=1 Tax=unclassified Haladaptatus TaxID=2622732 RepID=UPI0023E8BC88|nr:MULTISPECIES: ABC transporter permease [unclassified Haladaptatus]